MVFGVGRDIITPPIKTRMGGYWTEKRTHPFLGIHDDLYAKTLLLDDGKNKVLLISLDALFHCQKITREVEGYAIRKYGVGRGSLFIACTHTHSGPALRNHDKWAASEEYECFLVDRIKRSIDRAFANSFEGYVSIGSVQGDWNINRRIIRDGKYFFGPNPDGIKDDYIYILKICDTENNMRALLLNYACHPATLRDNMLLCAEYPGRLCQLLDARFYGSTAIFFQGAGGNTRPKISAVDETFRACSFDEMSEMAYSMYSEVEKAVLAGNFKEITPDLSSIKFNMLLDTEPYPREYFEAALNDGKDQFPYMRDCLREIVDTYEASEAKVEVPGGIVKLGDDAYISLMGGEPCYEVKLNVMQAFMGKELIFIGYLDDSAYIPDDKIVMEGGYEAEGSIIEYRHKGRFITGIDRNILEYYIEGRKLLDRKA